MGVLDSMRGPCQYSCGNTQTPGGSSDPRPLDTRRLNRLWQLLIHVDTSTSLSSSTIKHGKKRWQTTRTQQFVREEGYASSAVGIALV